MKALKIIGILAVVGVLAGVGLYLYVEYKPQKNAATAKADVTITAADLAKEYAASEKAADAKYLNKNIQVTGIVSEMDKNQDGGVMVMLDSGDPMSGIQCAMQDKNVTVTKGQSITVKGFCSGYNLGVALTGCVIK